MGKKFLNPYRKFYGSVIPNFLMRRSDVSQGAKLCYGRLAQFAGKDGSTFPSQGKLAGELGISTRMVRKYLNELAKHKLIHVVRNGKTQPNSYKFLHHPWMKSDEKYSSYHDGTLVPNTKDNSSSHERKNTSDSDRNHNSYPNKENHSNKNHLRESNKEKGYDRIDQLKIEIPEGLKEIKGFEQKYKKWYKYLLSKHGELVDEFVIQEELGYLLELHQKGHSPIDVISQSIRNKSKSFYPLRDRTMYTNGKIDNLYTYREMRNMVDSGKYLESNFKIRRDVLDDDGNPMRELVIHSTANGT